MNENASRRSMIKLAIAGLLALAAAMGVGRFAATPLLPLMQQSDGLSLAQGAWMATANYAGYLTGALLSFLVAPSAPRSARWGLVAVLASTVAMALIKDVHGWYLLRFIAGLAGALVLVGVSDLALSILGASRQAALTGVVFAGVGFGSVVVGLIALLAAIAGWDAHTAWWLLAAFVLAVTVHGWSTWSPLPAVSGPTSGPGSGPRSEPSGEPGGGASRGWGNASTTAPVNADSKAVAVGDRAGLGRQAWTLILAYGVFGLGYIVPATFLPAMARDRVDDPLVYGGLWPVFGLAAAISTVVTTWRFRAVAPQTLFVVSLAVMAVGVVVPVLQQSLASLVISALAVGGTFMVATMAGLWRARQLVAGSPSRLIAAMTAAFATGQLLGPALVALGAGQADPLRLPSLAAGALLLGGAALVWRDGLAQGRRRDPDSRGEVG